MRAHFHKSKVDHSMLEDEIVDHEINNPIKNEIRATRYTVTKKVYCQVFSKWRIKKVYTPPNPIPNCSKNLIHLNLEDTKKAIGV
jgi:hypothetical protein